MNTDITTHILYRCSASRRGKLNTTINCLNLNLNCCSLVKQRSEQVRDSDQGHRIETVVSMQIQRKWFQTLKSCIIADSNRRLLRGFHYKYVLMASARNFSLLTYASSSDTPKRWINDTNESSMMFSNSRESMNSLSRVIIVIMNNHYLIGSLYLSTCIVLLNCDLIFRFKWLKILRECISINMFIYLWKYIYRGTS